MSTALLNEVLKLPVEDRVALLHKLQESIGQEADFDEEPEWLIAELDRRMALHDANPGSAVTIEELEKTLFPDG